MGSQTEVSQASNAAYSRALAQEQVTATCPLMCKKPNLSSFLTTIRAIEMALMISKVAKEPITQLWLIIIDAVTPWLQWEVWNNCGKNAHNPGIRGKIPSKGRYLRFWDNHDDDWNHPNLVEKLLVQALSGIPLKVCENLDNACQRWQGSISKALPYQRASGTIDSDKIAPLSKLITGHTHRPVFKSKTQEAAIRKSPTKAEDDPNKILIIMRFKIK